jgi:hypothetical protein
VKALKLILYQFSLFLDFVQGSASIRRRRFASQRCYSVPEGTEGIKSPIPTSLWPLSDAIATSVVGLTLLISSIVVGLNLGGLPVHWEASMPGIHRHQHRTPAAAGAPLLENRCGVLRDCPIEVSSCKLASQPGVERPQ